MRQNQVGFSSFSSKNVVFCPNLLEVSTIFLPVHRISFLFIQFTAIILLLDQNNRENQAKIKRQRQQNYREETLTSDDDAQRITLGGEHHKFVPRE